MLLPTDPPSSFFPGSNPDSIMPFVGEESLPVDNASLTVVPKIGPLGALGISAALSIGRLLINQLLQDRANRAQNAYNSPKAQVARLKAAGLNPAAVMGQTASHNVGQFSAAQSNDSVSPAEILQLQNQYEQNRLLRAQRKSVELDNKYKSDTMESRVKRAAVSLVTQSLGNQLTEGKITYQEYANAIKELDKDWIAFISQPNVNYGGFSPREAVQMYNPYRLSDASYDKATMENAMLRIRKDFAEAFGITDSPSNAFDAFFKAFQMLFHYFNVTRDGGGYN